MQEAKPKILVFGLGCFGMDLVKTLVVDWQVIAVDMDEKRADSAQEDIPDVDFYSGAAGSMVTWKKLDLTDVKYIILTMKDSEVNREACRIAREVLHIEVPIILLVYDEYDEELFAPFRVTPVNSLDAGIGMILKELGKSAVPAINVGLGEGELIEVKIQTRSHLVDRKLKHLRPTRWHISAIYRDNALILPDGNSSLQVGDRVLLVGHPTVLANVIAILLKGKPQFPLQYGTDIVFPLHPPYNEFIDEAVYFLDHTMARRIRFIPFEPKPTPEVLQKIKENIKHYEIGQTIELFREIFSLPLDTGLLVVPVEKGWFKGYRIRETFKTSRRPFLISRFTFPYRGIVVFLNGPAPLRALETGIELSRLLEVPFQVVNVSLPREMRGKEDEDRLQLCRNTIADFEGIYKKTFLYKVLEGNPVRKTLEYLSTFENHLLVMVNDPDASVSFFKPNVPYMVARRTHLSTLVIPEIASNG